MRITVVRAYDRAHLISTLPITADRTPVMLFPVRHRQPTDPVKCQLARENTACPRSN
ncbi:hypothetical protein [Streptomyces sp. NPDC005141]